MDCLFTTYKIGEMAFIARTVSHKLFTVRSNGRGGVSLLYPISVQLQL